MILRARTQSAAFYSGHSGQSPLLRNHIEPHCKDKVGSVPRSRHLGNHLSTVANGSPTVGRLFYSRRRGIPAPNWRTGLTAMRFSGRTGDAQSHFPTYVFTRTDLLFSNLCRDANRISTA